METRRDLSPEDLHRPDWNSLLNNYSKHDIGEAYFKGRVEGIGMHVEHWGIDKRHEDENLIFDNKMDLRLWEPLDEQDSKPQWPDDDSVVHSIEESWDIGLDTIERRWDLRAVADVKTKASESWFGRFNLRHLAHYAEWAHEYDVPVFVYMTMVNPDAESVGEMDFLTPIPEDWDWDLLVDHYDTSNYTDLSYGELKDTARTCPMVERTFRAPDGNLVIEVEDDHKFNWDYLVENVL